MGLFKRQIVWALISLCIGDRAWALVLRCAWGEQDNANRPSALCGSGSVSIDATLVSKGATKLIRTAEVSSYAGLHLGPVFSLHLSGEANRQIFSPTFSGKDAEHWQQSAMTTAALQVGNPVHHPVRVLYGRLPVPFGLRADDTPEGYRIFENKGLWGDFSLGGILVFDDLRNRTLEVGVGKLAGEISSPLISFTSIPQLMDDAVATRLSYDVSSLEGTRLIASGLVMRQGERRFGFSLLNEKASGESTSFEFVRRLAQPDGKGPPFEQLLRLNHVTAWKNGRRLILAVDDERMRFRSGLLIGERKVSSLSDMIVWRLGLSFHKAETVLTRHSWWAIMGITSGF